MSIKNYLITLVIFFSIQSNAQEDYYSPQNMLLFAEYLFQNNEYFRAAGEFQRYSFSLSNENRDNINFKIALCYDLAGKQVLAEKYYRDVINSKNKEFVEITHYQVAHLFYKTKEYDRVLEYSESILPNISSWQVIEKMVILNAITSLQKRKWRDAQETMNSFEKNKQGSNMFSSAFIKLNIDIKKALSLPYKSKILAGIYSTIIPGSGKIYSGRIYDGMFSFITIGLFAWQAYSGFSKDGTSSVKGWIYGSLASTFYIGNIYGSIISVDIYNDKLEEDFLSKIKLNLSWNFK